MLPWFGPKDAAYLNPERRCLSLSHTTTSAERRRWERLSVPVPMFIKGVDERGKKFLEFGTAINICAGGALLASRRFLPNDSKVSLEIPPPPFPKEKSKARNLRARVVHVRTADRYHLSSLAFSKPLSTD
jgi:PilZ domain